LYLLAGLLFAGFPVWIANVPVDEDQATGNGIAPITQDGAAFTTTQWSVVLAAQGPSPAAQAALDKLCRTYWRPIYGFVRRQGVKPEEAKEFSRHASGAWRLFDYRQA
jgi:hypothetical protein